MVHRVIYSPRHPGADCLGGPCQGQPSSFLVQPACGLGEGVEGWISWSVRAAGPQPEDLCRLSYSTEATATTHEQGRWFLWPKPDIQFLTLPFPLCLYGPTFPPPTWAQKSQHMYLPPKEASYQTGAWGEEHWEALGARNFSTVNQLCDLGERTSLSVLIPSLVQQGG